MINSIRDRKAKAGEKHPREKLSDQMALAAIVFGVMAFFLAVVVFWGEFALVAIAFMVGVAAGGLGAVLGFLFGIPKPAEVGSAAASEAATKHVASRRMVANTNLGQVSDWVTKIVIGLGIAQFGQVLDGAHWLADRFAGVFDEGLSPEAAATYGMAVTISSAAWSFMLVYLWTSTRLPDVWDPDPDLPAEATTSSGVEPGG